MILSALCPLLCNSIRPQHTLQMFADHCGPKDKPYHEKPLIRDCFNLKGSCTLFRPYVTIAAGISPSSFVRVSTRQLAVSSLSKGISSTLNFHESIGHWRDLNLQPLAPKASAVSIELTWLPYWSKQYFECSDQGFIRRDAFITEHVLTLFYTYRWWRPVRFIWTFIWR